MARDFWCLRALLWYKILWRRMELYTCNSTEYTVGVLRLSNETNITSQACWLLEEIEKSKRFLLPWWKILLWSILFGITVLTSAFGNLGVIWIAVSDKRIRNITNYFLVNLAIADTMISLFNVVFNFVYMVTNHWPFGNVYCKISQFIAVASVSSSAFSLTVISMERYLAIVHPLRPRMRKKTSLGLLFAVWVASFIISLPHLIFAETGVLLGSGRTACYLGWPDGHTFQSYHEYVYNLTFTVFTYFLPICIMSFTYIQAGRDLWSKKAIGECKTLQQEIIRSKRKIVKMLIVVVAIFAICWLPYHVYFIVSWLHPEINKWESIQEIYLGIYWLAISTASYYPIIYCWMNSRFRLGFLKAFRFVFGLKFVDQQGLVLKTHAREWRYKGYLGNSNRGNLSYPGITVTSSLHCIHNAAIKNANPLMYSNRTM